MAPSTPHQSQQQPNPAPESPPPSYNPRHVIRRPPTPFHFPGLPRDDESEITDDDNGQDRITNAIANNHATSLSSGNHTVRRATSSGLSIPVISDTQQSTPTTIEYAFADPSVATASLRAQRAMNPDHRYIRRTNSGKSRQMSRSSRAGTPSSPFGGGSRPGSTVIKEEAGYSTDSDQRIRQRLVDNAIVIPSPSGLGSQNRRGKHRNQPLHREYSAGKLRPALRVVQIDMAPASQRPGDKQFGSIVETMQVEDEMNIRLSDTSRQAKPLPPPPPPIATGERRGGGTGSRRHSQTFSLQRLRQSLPSIGAALRSSSSIHAPRPSHIGASRAYERPEIVGSPSDAFPPVQTYHCRPQPVASSTARAAGILEGHHSIQPPSIARQRTEAAALKDPADNLNIYLRHAHLPKWTRWIDPDRNVQSRWHNTSNWGTGRAHHSTKDQLKDPQSFSVAPRSSPEAIDPRSGMISSRSIGQMSGRVRTIDRLVRSVVTNQTCNAADSGGGGEGQRRHVQARPSSSSLTANIQDLDPGKRESGAKQAAGGSSAGGYRFLKSWEARRGFLDSIENFYEKNVPYNSIDPANRWGEQIFALEANGFHTLRFHDEAAVRTEDAGLLGWFTGAVLKTAVSALHLLRYNAQDFGFHVLPASLAPRVTTGEQGHHHFERGGHSVDVPAEMPDGCGTLVLVNKRVAKDRAMIVIVRPPWLIGSAELKDFAKAALSWRQSSPTYLEKQEGQANLLQAQVFDDCYSNYCFFFCVTNLKHWVFGHFNPDFTRCAVGPVVSRKAKNPSVMQVLTVWLVRSLDERPQSRTTTTGNVPISSRQPEETSASPHLRVAPTSPRTRGGFLPAHDSGSTLGTGCPYELGHGYGSQYTDVQARHHTSLPPGNFSNAFAIPYSPNQAYLYTNASSSTQPSWYDMTFQQRQFTSGGDTFQYPPSNHGVVHPYTPDYHTMSSPPMTPLHPVMAHPKHLEDDRRRTRESSGRRSRRDE